MKKFLTSLLLLCLTANAFTQTLTVEDFSTGYSWLTGVAHAPNDDRLFVFQKDGLLKICNPNGQQAGTFLDISAKVKNLDEYGLVGLAFHPNYASNGYFYVFYNQLATGACTVARYSRNATNPNLANPNSELILMTWPHPESHHVGGCMKFGPDGFLYIASGDGASLTAVSTAAQNLQSYLGKILRIDVNNGATYTVPASNPFVGNSNIFPEVYAYGLRNPWRISFDKYTGGLYIADVGQDEREEVDYQPDASTAGKNYGWPCLEGTLQFNAANCNANTIFTPPYFEYNHAANNGCSISGGVVYRGGEYGDLFGKYIYADFCSGRIWSLNTGSTSPVAVEGANFADNDLTMIEENNKGELFAVGFFSNKIYRVRSQNCAPTAFIPGDAVRTLQAGGSVPMSAYPVVSGYGYQWLLNGSPIAGQTGTQLTATQPGTYTVQVTNPANGCQNTSAVVTVNGSGGGACSITASLASTQCLDNGTPNNPADDRYKVFLNVSGTNTGIGWNASTNGNSNNYSYGNNIALFGDFAISNGAWTLTIFDANSPTSPCFTTVNIVPPATCSNGGGSGQIDLSLVAQQLTASPAQWSNYPVKLTLSNAGPQAATGVKVKFAKPAGVVYVGGNQFTASQGSFNPNGDEVWTVGSIPANGSATLTVNYFLLNATAPTAYAQVTAANETDGDSQPNNGTPPTPVQDDEASTAGGGGPACSIMASASTPTCNDNGTPTNPADDRYSFSLTATNPVQGVGYQVFIPQTSQTFQGTYGAPLTIQNVPISTGTLTLNLTDNMTVGCSTSVGVNAPVPCSNQTVQQPDLSFSSAQVSPTAFQAGSTFNLQFTIQNFGNANANGFAITHYLSTDAIFSQNDVVIGGLSSYLLSAGSSNPVTQQFSLPANTAPGNYFLILVADPANLFLESNENNNAFPLSVTVIGGSPGQIDLSLTAQLLTASPAQWSNYPVKLTLSNAGPQAATDVKLKFAKPTGVVYVGGNEFTASQGSFNPNGDEVWTVGNIPANGSATLTVNYFLLNATAPVAYAQVTAHTETDGDSQPNNGTPPTPVQDDEAATSSGGGDPTPQPDLTIADLQIPNASVAAGAILSYNFDASNAGTAAVSGNFTIKSYISTDQTLSANDIQDGNINTGNYGAGFSVQNVAGASTIQASLAAGSYYLIVKIDGDNAIAEGNENNNTVVRPFTVTAAGGCPGNFVNNGGFEDGVANWGNATHVNDPAGAHSGSGYAKICASSPNTSDNEMFKTITLQGGFFPLQGNFTYSLNAWVRKQNNSTTGFLRVNYFNNLGTQVGSSSDALITSTTWQQITLTLSPPAGTIYISLNFAAGPAASGLCVSVDDVCLTVNGSTALPELGGFLQELIHSEYNCYSNPGGGFAVFSVYVSNAGAAPAGPFKVKHYISTDNVLSANDLLWATVDVPSLNLVGNGGPVEAGPNQPLPTSLPMGKYFVLIRIDADGQVAEGNENNNLIDNIQIQVGAPSIALTNISGVPSSVQPGGSFSLSANVSFAANNFPPSHFGGDYSLWVRLLQSNGNTVPLGQFTFPMSDFNAAASVTKNLPITVPASVAAGSYTLAVQVSAPFYCEDLSNNSQALPLSVGGGGSPCAAVTITPGPSKLTIAGASAPHVLIKVFRPNWTLAYECLDGQCANPVVVSNLTPGTYHIQVKLINSGWGEIRFLQQDVNVSSLGGGGGSNIAKQEADRFRLSFDKFYPNPTAFLTNIELFSPKQQGATLDFYNQQGRLVHSMEVRLEEGSNNLEVLVFDWKSGTYNVIARGEETGLPAYGRFLKVWEE